MGSEDAFWRGAHPVCRGGIGVGGGGDDGQILIENQKAFRD